MRIVIMPNSSKEHAVETGFLLAEKLKARGIENQVFLWENKGIYTSKDYDAIFNDTDMAISIGGDGTFLHTAREACLYGIPVLGINMGNLGFLTELDGKNACGAVDLIINGQYTIEERMMIDVSLGINGVAYHNYALNDVVISRADSSRMLHLDISINDKFVSSYRGDGLIVATPTGSTAYSLSAGGPIVEPSNEVILVTPICPHSLAARPIVASPGSTIKVNIVNSGVPNKGMLSADGQEGVLVAGEGEIVISRSRRVTRVVRMMNKDFFSILKEKINR